MSFWTFDFTLQVQIYLALNAVLFKHQQRLPEGATIDRQT